MHESILADDKSILLFDLDDTLIIEEQAALDALAAVASEGCAGHGIDPYQFALAVKRNARKIWYALPSHPYCKRIGISSWEGLWSRFLGDHPQLALLRSLAASYRYDSWYAALEEYGIASKERAGWCAEEFCAERRKRHQCFPETIGVLTRLASDYRLALITTGASDLQREKIAGCNLSSFFKAIVISGDHDIAKPDRRIFDITLESMGGDASQAVMTGNNLHTDIQGAVNAGIASVWINRSGMANDSSTRPDHEIHDLQELLSS